MNRVIVVGGGISGLATAYLLSQRQPELEVTLLEQTPHVGGKVRSSREGGYTVDWGPNGFLTNVTETLELARAVGLEGDLLAASEGAKHRFLYQDGGLRPVPLTPAAFLKSDLLGLGGKLRVALEPLAATLYSGTKRAPTEETVHAFLTRHFGRAFAEVFGGPFVLGITAGDAKALSLDALFPRFREMEQTSGSLLRGMVRAQRAAKKAGRTGAGGRLTSFGGGGMQRLIDALRAALDERIRVGEGVQGVTPATGGYRVRLESGETLETDALILATPAYVSADFVQGFAPDVADDLRGIPYADVTVVGLGYDRIDVPNALQGFGFLVPRGEGVRALGVLYGSSLFANQAPEGKVLLRVIAGGSVDPALAALTPEQVLAVVRRDLEVTLGITAEPEMVRVVPWPQGIPQYLVGHRERVARIMAVQERFPGLYLTGNGYYGVGVNDCVRDAKRVARAVATLTG